MTGINYRSYLTTSTPEKSLVKGYKRDMGRNDRGRITMRHKGGGSKRLYRLVDFTYDKKDIPARILSIEYDPYRTGFIALVCYTDGEKRYVLAPKEMRVGDSFVVAADAPVKIGNRLSLRHIPIGTFIYNIEVKPGGGAKLSRAAGNYAEVVALEGDYVSVKLPSTEVRKLLANCFASIGSVSNEENRLVNLGKAGRSRWLGIRPTVRGTAMNPVDHPHGGGEGRQGRGTRRAKNYFGNAIGKGQKSRRPKKYSNRLIVSRRRVGRGKKAA